MIIYLHHLPRERMQNSACWKENSVTLVRNYTSILQRAHFRNKNCGTSNICVRLWKS